MDELQKIRQTLSDLVYQLEYRERSIECILSDVIANLSVLTHHVVQISEKLEAKSD